MTSPLATNDLESKAQPATVALFVSDLHLHATLPHTTAAFFGFLDKYARHAKQLFLLGDVFEYWAGDDDMDEPYNQSICNAIKRLGDSGLEVFWIAGNRDFLAGQDFARRTGVHILPDPFVATIASQRIVLTHGDAMCTDDLSYMAFRAQVREAGWQQAFLSKPLVERKKIIEGMRHGSKQAQQGKSADIMDVNAEAVASVFAASGTAIMIHGHTHRPARHRHSLAGGSATRYVLPDWELDNEPKRGGWLAIDADGVVKRYGFDGTIID